MAKKKRKSGKPAKQWLPRDLPLPDHRVLEQMMSQFGADDSAVGPPETPEDEALDVMYRAYKAAEPEQVNLARQALNIWPDCADAYVLLAEHAKSLDEALALYQHGVEAGARALRKDAFAEAVGHFWGILETRAYMRAREGLAQCLWEAGRREEAAEHYQEMLRLNPNDNQGVRWSLATLLLDLDRDVDVGQLLDDYNEDASSFWAYTKALAAFRQEGETARANQLLKRAAKSNKHVPGYLLGHERLPAELPPYMMLGGEDEAASYATGNRRVWLNTPGAISWLRQTLPAPRPQPTKRRRPAWPQLRLALLRYPQAEGEIWQVDAMPAPGVGPGSEPDDTPWMLLIADPESHELVAADVVGPPPTPSVAWEFLLDTMNKPQTGDPRRPAAIEIRQPAFAKAWKAKLKQIAVACVVVDELAEIEALRDRMHAGAAGPMVEAGSTELRELPLEPGEVWQADIRPMPSWVMGERGPYRPWMGLVISRTEDLVLAHNLTEERPPADWLWESVAQALLRPAMGEPHRPGVIEVATEEQRDALLPHLEAAGVECIAVGELQHFDAAMASMAEHLGPEGVPPSLLDAPGIELGQLASFYAAAAEFYRRRPWQRVLGDTPIKVECEKFHSGPWYAVVMGQLGVEQGVAIYENLAVVQRIIAHEKSDAENARGMSALSLTYGEAFDISTRELDAAEKHGWPVAGPEAYPAVIRINPGMAVRTPLAWELELLEGCLRTIPDFLAGKAASLTVAVAVALASGQLPLRLSWAEH